MADYQDIEGFTPPPWMVSYGADERQGMSVATDIRIRDRHIEFGSMIALLHNPGVPEAEANARLIAAAPEMHADNAVMRAALNKIDNAEYDHTTDGPANFERLQAIARAALDGAA